MNDEWSQHKEQLAQAWRGMMRNRTKDQLRDIAINDRHPGKRVAAIEELVRRLKA